MGFGTSNRPAQETWRLPTLYYGSEDIAAHCMKRLCSVFEKVASIGIILMNSNDYPMFELRSTV